MKILPISFRFGFFTSCCNAVSKRLSALGAAIAAGYYLHLSSNKERRREIELLSKAIILLARGETNLAILDQILPAAAKSEDAPQDLDNAISATRGQLLTALKVQRYSFAHIFKGISDEGRAQLARLKAQYQHLNDLKRVRMLEKTPTIAFHSQEDNVTAPSGTIPTQIVLEPVRGDPVSTATEEVSEPTFYTEEGEIVVRFHMGSDEAPSEPELPVATAILSDAPRAIAPAGVEPPRAVAEPLPKIERQQVDPYALLSLPRESAEAVGKMIAILSTTSIPGLAFKKKELKALGTKIEAFHTLKFIECVFVDPQLKQHLCDIRKTSRKWNAILWGEGSKGGEQGTAGNLNSLAKAGSLDPLLPGFCKALNADLQTVRAFAAKLDWEAMLVYLLSAKT